MPKICKSETESYFRSVGAMKTYHDYPCYYSSTEPTKVVLKKYSSNVPVTIVVPVFVLCFGLVLLPVVKLCGHKIGCPSQEQIQRNAQEQWQQQQHQQQQQQQQLALPMLPIGFQVT